MERVESTKPDFKIWCEHCCIRVAPNEEQTVVAGKTYHSQCYPKVEAKSKSRRRTS